MLYAATNSSVFGATLYAVDEIGDSSVNAAGGGAMSERSSQSNYDGIVRLRAFRRRH